MNRKTERAEIRNLCGFYYDVQKLRIACGQRYRPKEGDAPELYLGEDAKKKFEIYHAALTSLEKSILTELKSKAEISPIWPWLLNQRGIDIKLASVLISELDIHKAEKYSQFWHHAGMHVANGKAPRRTKGEKSSWNSFLRSKVRLMAECMIKARNEHYRSVYDSYKESKEKQIVDCIRCKGSKIEPNAKYAKCKNCGGAGRGPWGYNKQHRHNAALRYMAKEFLKDLWTEWKRVEKISA